jgi:hypothetical protein
MVGTGARVNRPAPTTLVGALVTDTVVYPANVAVTVTVNDDPMSAATGT